MSCVSVSADDAGTETFGGEVIYKNPYSPLAKKAVQEATKSTHSTEHDAPLEDGPPVPSPPSSCAGIPATLTESDYSLNISNNFKIRDFTIKAVFAHKIKAQRGLSESDIVCNLKALSENCIEPIFAQYPGFKVNSGFRQAQNGKSEHEIGSAADLQWPGISRAKLKEICDWAATNLPSYNQLIYEVPAGSGGWLHVSFNRTQNRMQQLTFVGGSTYKPGIVSI